MTAAGLAIDRALRRSRGMAQTLAEVEPWLVIPCVVAGLAAPRLLGAALAVAGFFWLVRWVAWGEATVPTAGDVPVAGLALMIPVTMWVTALPEVTREQTLWLLSGMALFYVIVNWMRSAERERTAVRLLVGVGLLTAVVAPFAITWVTAIKLTMIPEALYGKIPLLARVPVHPNVLAGALVLGLPVPLALLLFGGKDLSRGERAASAVAVAGIAVILVLTKSRGAMLGGAAAGLTLAALRWRRAWIAIALGGLATGVALWRTGAGPVIAKLSAAGATVGWPGRFEIWSRALYLTQDFPFTGIGMGTFKPVVNALYPFLLLGPNADVPHAHNLFLQVAVDLGLPGLVAWLALLTAAAMGAWRVFQMGRREARPWDAAVGAGLLGAQIAMVTHGVLDAAVWGSHSGLVVWAVWGVCMASANLRTSATATAMKRVNTANDRYLGSASGDG
jgi:putative inorganic carbon (HCO3(-)) transporter